MVSRTVQPSVCWSWLAPARGSWWLNIHEFFMPIIKPFVAWNCQRWEYTTAIGRHKSGLAFFFLESTVLQTLTVFLVFSTLLYETHLSFFSRWQSHCLEPMGPQGADGGALPAPALHPALLSPFQGCGSQWHRSSSDNCSSSNCTQTSPASCHFVCDSALIGSSPVSPIRVMAGDKSVSEKRKTFFPFKI